MHAGVDGEPVAVLLEFGHPHGQLGERLVRLLQQVPFDAHVAEERHGHAQFLAGGTLGGVRGTGTHVLAHHRRRHQQRGVALDIRALDRVHAVGDPDTVSVL